MAVSDLLSYQKECSAAFPDSPAERFLEEQRGITPETASRFGVGFDSKQQCIVFPYYTPDGSIHRFKLRDRNGQRYTQGEGVIPFGLPTLTGQDRVIVCEGETDTLRLAQELGTEEAVLGIPGAQSVGCLEEYLPEGVTLYSVFDTDKAGKLATVKVIEKYGARPAFLPSDVKDVCEYFQAGYTREDFLGLVEQADIVHDLKHTVAEADALAAEAKNEIDAMVKNVSAPAVGVLMSEVQPEQISWLWPGYIPLGKLAVLDGDPGLGKSTLALNVAARISKGHAMPDGSGGGEPGGVVILSAEDGLGDTIRPRLEAAGADLSRIVALDSCPDSEGTDEHPPVLPDDLEWIKKSIERVNARLVIVDPLMAFLSGNTNSHRDQDIRRVLARMAALAEETGVAIVVIRHLNKMAGGNPLYRGGGSIGIIGAARSGLLVARDPEQEQDGERRVLASTKSNLGPKPESLSFHLEQAENDASRVVWDGASTHDANALLLQADDSERGPLEEAMEFLNEELADGPVAANEIYKRGREAGHSERTLKRAKGKLKVESNKQGLGGWAWELSKGANLSSESPINSEECQGSNSGTLGTLQKSGTLREADSTEPELSELRNQGRLAI